MTYTAYITKNRRGQRIGKRQRRTLHSAGFILTITMLALALGIWGGVSLAVALFG